MYDDDVSPDIETVGPGEAELAVVCNVHGDEPTGARAIHRFLKASPSLDRAVKFVVANPPASIVDRRYLDVDMNRQFPGDPDADERERRLAAQLVEATSGCVTVSVHTTHATPEPIALVSEGRPRALDVVSDLPIAYVVNDSPVIDTAFNTMPGVVSIEAGKVDQANAVAKAEMLIRAFLDEEGAVSGAPPMHAPETEYFEIYDTVEKPSGDESHELLARNFERVESGEAYATSENGTLVADEPFVPILMSQSGYSDFFGYRGRKVGDSVEDAKAAWLDE